MAKIIRVVEHNGILFKEGDYVKVFFDDGRQIRGRIRIPTMESIVVGQYGLYEEMKNIRHMKKLK